VTLLVLLPKAGYCGARLVSIDELKRKSAGVCDAAQYSNFIF
jgi:hypothetical protein